MTNTADVERGIMQGYLTECETQNGRLRRQNAVLLEAIAEWVRRHEGGPWDCTACEVLRHLPVDDSEPAS